MTLPIQWLNTVSLDPIAQVVSSFVSGQLDPKNKTQLETDTSD